MTPDDGAGQLQEWTCDTCGEPITDPARGLVVWRVEGKEDGSTLYRDFQIVHKTFLDEPDPRRCDPGNEAGYTYSLELDNFLGATGLTRLLSYLSAGPLQGGGGSRIAQEDLDAYVDLVRRVQIPNYDRARARFDDEATHSWFGDANEFAPYTPEMLGYIAAGRLAR